MDKPRMGGRKRGKVYLTQKLFRCFSAWINYESKHFLYRTSLGLITTPNQETDSLSYFPRQKNSSLPVVPRHKTNSLSLFKVKSFLHHSPQRLWLTHCSLGL